jgi:hypothetical protein
MCETDIRTVSKSVARMRLVKAENTQRVLVICKVCSSAMALCYLQLRVECINPIIQPKSRLINHAQIPKSCQYLKLTERNTTML